MLKTVSEPFAWHDGEYEHHDVQVGKKGRGAFEDHNNFSADQRENL